MLDISVDWGLQVKLHLSAYFNLEKHSYSNNMASAPKVTIVLKVLVSRLCQTLVELDNI